METVNVSGLKNNPSEALRKSHRDLVVVMNRDKPDALMVGVGLAGILDAKGVKPALATALFRDGHLPLARAARLAEMSVGELVAHLSRLGIPVVGLDEDETERDMDTHGVMARLVLTDASPLIGLARIGGLNWLGELFGVGWMPPEVRCEVLPNRGLQDEMAILAAEAAVWLKQTDAAPDTPALPELDEGETACIRTWRNPAPAAPDAGLAAP